MFCPCGTHPPAIAGLCPTCYHHRRNSRHRFNGNRDLVLDRDRRRCRGCGAIRRLIVHHRRPGNHAPELLVTLCAGCHARIHRLLSLRGWLPAPLVELWTEQHPGTPVQMQLDLAWEADHG